MSRTAKDTKKVLTKRKRKVLGRAPLPPKAEVAHRNHKKDPPRQVSVKCSTGLGFSIHEMADFDE